MMTPDQRITRRAAELMTQFPHAIEEAPIPVHETGLPGYRYQYYASWVVVILLAFTGAIQLAGPSDLGLSPVAFRWLGILASVLGVAQGFLPSLRRPPVAQDDAGPVANRDPMPRDT